MKYTKEFWQALAERVISTMAQVAIPLVAATGLDKIDWKASGFIVLGAGLLSVLKGFVAVSVGNNGPSLTSVEELTPPATAVTP
jgi:hypothetical protein